MVDHIRHSGIFQVKDQDISVVGCGGIGAITAITLAKMGFDNIQLFDTENVEQENIATQFHPFGSLDRPKNLSVQREIGRHDPSIVINTFGNVDSETDLTGHFIFCTVDSIASRKVVWEAARKSKWLYYLDARMGAEVFQLYTVHSKNAEWYDTRLAQINEDDIPELPCTEKATIYTAMGAASFIGGTVRKLLTGEPVSKFQQMDYVNGTFFHSGLDTENNIPTMLK